MDDLRQTLVSLSDMGIDDLRGVWRERLGEPPAVRSTEILRRSLAEALQLAASGTSGRLDPRLTRASAQHRAGRKTRIKGATFRTGSTLVREWKGTQHEVQVTPEGYVWNGQRHDSLSKVARLITGVRWNGPRFFGLREGTGA
ncbi:MAG: DUF2924 domain-containing protein [Alphaproteobacteria bacterium]|nr:MAG: DUF2924 domain-containing protein [Alphaproteobacteria bacterium]